VSESGGKQSGGKKRNRKRKKRKQRGGGRTYLTPELQARIIALIEQGNALSVAAECCGVPNQTASDWRRWGEEGKEPYSGFSGAVRVAEAAVEAKYVSMLEKHAMGFEVRKTKRRRVDKPDGVEITEEETIETKYSLSAITTWLKCRRPERWAEREETDAPPAAIIIKSVGIPRPGDDVPTPPPIEIDNEPDTKKAKKQDDGLIDIGEIVD
jgi:hypothetical protein